jgi:cytochrome P450
LSQSTQRTHPELQELEWYRSMRDNDPVWRDPETGVWNVFRYQDVATILADYRTFSSDFSEVLPDLAELTEGNILATDPPYHHQLRSLVSQAFTPRAVARLEARIEELTEELLDQTQGRTRIELVSDLVYPLPVIVIAELLGVPTADRSRFKTWAYALLSQNNSDPTDKAAIEATTDQRVALGVLLRRYSQLRVDPEIPLESFADPGFNGVQELHLLVDHA